MEKHAHHRSIHSHINDFLTHYRQRKYSPKSLASYKNALNSFARNLSALGVERIQEVTEGHIEAYRLSLVERKFSAAAMELYIRTVRQFFKYLEDGQQVFINPAAYLVIPHYTRRLLPVPTEEEMEKVLLQPNTGTPVGVRDRAFLETAYTAGLRREELFVLNVFDPDTGNGALRIIGKGNKERVVPLGKKAVYWLRQYIETTRPRLVKDLDDTALWISGTYGKRLSIAGINQLVAKYGKAVDLPLSVHAIRRACVTHMLRNGAHPIQIQMLLGHSGMKTLSQYLRVTITDLKKMHERSKPGR